MAAFCKLFTQTQRWCQTCFTVCCRSGGFCLQKCLSDVATHYGEVGRKSPFFVVPLPRCEIWGISLTNCHHYSKLRDVGLSSESRRVKASVALLVNIVSDASWAALTFFFFFNVEMFGSIPDPFGDCCPVCRSLVHSVNFAFYCPLPKDRGKNVVALVCEHLCLYCSQMISWTTDWFYFLQLVNF